MPPKKSGTDELSLLKKALKQQSLGPLYLFHGEEAYLREHYLSSIRSQLVPPALSAFHYHPIPAASFSIEGLIQAVDSPPMAQGRTLVVVFDVDIFKLPEEARGQLTDLISSLPGYVCLIFVYDLIPFRCDARTKLAQAWKAHGQTVEFARQAQGDLVRWLMRRFSAWEKTISPELAEYLIFLCGGMMTNLAGEVEKISAFSKEREITQGDIDAVAVPELNAAIFQMTQAISNGEFDRAFQVLSCLLTLKEPPIRILSHLGFHLRQLYMARLNYEEGGGLARLAQLCGIQEDYRARRLHQACRRFSCQWCRRAILLTAQADLELKRTGQPPQDILAALLLKLSMPASASWE